MAVGAVIICIERERLKRAYLNAILEFNELSNQRLEAIIGGTKPPTIKLVASANARKDAALYAFFAHVYEHRC
jgi:hypothetical protein